MDTFAQLFEHLPEIRVIVCKPCTIAIPPTQIVGHLARHHPKVLAAKRSGFAAYARTLPNLAWEPTDVCIAKPAGAPILSLKLQENGLVCTAKRCWFTCTTLRGIQGHCKDKHAWTNKQKRGGDMRRKSQHSDNRLWRDSQLCQRLFRAVGWPAYMAIEARATGPSAEEIPQVVMADLKRKKEEQEVAAAQEPIRESTRQQADPWLELTEWIPHLKGISRAALLCARQPADEEVVVRGKREEGKDSDLADACRAMRRLVRKAFHSSQPEIASRPVREIIERRETGAESNERPFYSGHKVRTIKKYSRRLVQILCYLWRTYEQTRRPPYKLTGRQEALLWSLRQLARREDPARSEKLEAGCLHLWIALLDHSLSGNEHESALLSGVAVLGLKDEHHGGGWVPAHEFSPTLSALITTSKALVIHHAQRQHDEALLRYPDTAPTAYELVKEMAERFLTLCDYQGAPSPMNRILRLRTLARTEAKKHNTSGIVAWDRDRLLVDKQSFTLADLRSMIKGLCETVRLQLLKDVLLLDLDERDRVRAGTTALPELAMDKLVDQPAELATGWSFLKHPSNKLGHWPEWLLNRVLTEASLRDRFICGVDSSQQPARALWRDSAVCEYMRGVRRFKESLFALVHLSGGGPGRGTEITSIQCENSAEGVGYRGVFAEGGLLSFTTTYHKGYSFSKRVKTIHRYLPREVSELVVYFLGLGRPFIDAVQMLHNDVTRRTAFIWEPAPEEQWGDDSDSGTHSDESDGDDKDAGPLRHEKVRPANPDGYWGTDRIRRVLREQTFYYMGAALGTRAWRHAYPAIHRELAKDGQARDFLESLYWSKEPLLDDARALQSGHTLQTEEMNYGRSMQESPFQTMAERENFRRVSMDWHRVLQFASAWEDGQMHPGVRAELRAQQEEQSLQRWSTLATADLKSEFRRIAGRPDAEYRGKQEECLRAIVQRRLRVLAVMATGTGKSMLFMLPTSLSTGGITVVVAPLIALRDSLQDRCDELGIPCAKWDGRRPPYWARIVLVTPEGAVTKAFGRFIDEKRMLQQLDRIVIDECHVLLESNATWRPDVLKLIEMTEKGTQVVYLTATLPPTLQPAFLHNAGLTLKTLTVCRDERTTRTNIAYQVLDYERGTLDTVLATLVAAKRKRYGPEAQILVFCTSVEETKRLAKLLQCSAYYREMATDDDKARMVRNFTSGLEKLCTATSMLSLGLDAAGVRVVIHVSMCRLLLQYVQESGRAGRAGASSESIVLRACWQARGNHVEKSLGYKLESAARDFMSADSCRRVAIDRYMDGRQDRQQCEAEEAKCDLCEQFPRGVKRKAVEEEQDAHGQVSMIAAAAAKTQREEFEGFAALEERKSEIQLRRRTEQAGYQLERLRQHLDRWSNACVICMAAHAQSADHRWEYCQIASEAQINAVREKVRWMHRVKWEGYARCNYCWAPQALCNRWEETDTPGAFARRSNALCQYADVLQRAAAALLALRGPACKPWLERQMQRAAIVQGSYDEQLRRWLGLKTKMGEKDASQMCYLLYAWEEGQVQRCR
jgi:superfamily II DNA helicase RecQ